MSNLQEAINLLDLLIQENEVSKRFKEKAARAISILNSQEQLFLEKALLELEEMNSLEMSSYYRTQVWDIISLLESLKN
ncbi:MAG TPA: UPF0147 family protein [Candidatus Nanoarchaeia archaeon]|nr:UPF0147 family protein [Candidatus Nanoarchaeia archaeon]